MSKKVVIIGGGIAGLSTGIYALLNNYETEIYEMGANAGGLCCAWKRKDYLFDGCVHWLTGTDPSSDYYHLWEEIGAIQDKKFFNYEYFLKVREDNGKYLTFYNDPHRLKSELLAVAPEDKRVINQLVKDIRTLMQNELPVDVTPRKIIPMMRVLRVLFRYRMTAPEYAKRFKNPRLKKIIANQMDWNGMSIGFSFWAMGMMGQKRAGYPLGGSKGFIDSVMKRYQDLGGKIYFHSKIEKIITTGGKATGIRLSDGKEISADIVVSAADGHSTIFDWLDGKFVNQKILNLYEKLVPFPSLLLVYFGLRGDYSSEYHDFSFKPRTPVNIAGIEYQYLNLKIYNFDPAMAPEGKTVFMIMLTTDFDFWKKLREDKDAYTAEKKLVEKKILSALADIYPDIAERIEASDVATPMSIVRFTGNWRGSYQGWIMNKDSFTRTLPQTLPGLENFYMAGHWVTPGGGLPSGVITGRKAVKMMCREDKKEFKSS